MTVGLAVDLEAARATRSERPHATDRTFPLLTAGQLSNLPEPAWLVDGWLAAQRFNVLFGPSGAAKTFLALDLALCVANGIPWHGRATRRGPVVFIAAEGAIGLHRRVRAWEIAHDCAAGEGIHFLPEAVNLLELDDVERARNTVALVAAPALIVVDTMARTMVGGDENSSRDVGRFIANVDALRHPFSAASLVLHHTGWDNGNERGSSALRGASDMTLSLKPGRSYIQLKAVKAKDSEPEKPCALRLEAVGDSCVLRLGTDPAPLTDAARRILTAVSGGEPVSGARIMAAAKVAKSTFYREAKPLVERGYLAKEGSLYRFLDGAQQATVPSVPARSRETSDLVPSHGSLYGTVGQGSPGDPTETSGG